MDDAENINAGYLVAPYDLRDGVKSGGEVKRHLQGIAEIHDGKDLLLGRFAHAEENGRYVKLLHKALKIVDGPLDLQLKTVFLDFYLRAFRNVVVQIADGKIMMSGVAH